MYIIKTKMRIKEPGFFGADVIITVKGVDRSFGPGGFSVGGWDETAEARIETGGPKVKGPHVYIYGLCSVIDNHGGTAAIHDKARDEGKFFSVEAGDNLEIHGMVFKVGLDYMKHPTLTKISE